MTERCWVELQGGNPVLAAAEADGAAEAVGLRALASPGLLAPYRSYEGPSGSPRTLIGRLALARRCLVEVVTGGLRDLETTVSEAGRSRGSGRFRPLAGPRRPVQEPEVHALAGAFRTAGGHIDLERPDHSWVYHRAEGSWQLFEEVGGIDRAGLAARRMPQLPYRRPVSLPPRLGRVAVNLARLRPGFRVVDPFCGTGALLIEAAVLGGRCTGVDRDPSMVRGTLRNFAHVGRSVDGVRIGDAADAFPPTERETWDAIVTDPPYGRQSGSGGEEPGALVPRCLPEWTPFVRGGGFAVVIVPDGPPVLTDGWTEVARIPDRVHRSLTREFRVYRRDGGSTGS